MVRKANINDIEAVTAIYDRIHKMEAEGLVRIGWNPSIYPVRATAEEALQRGDLFVYEQEGAKGHRLQDWPAVVDGQLRACRLLEELRRSPQPVHRPRRDYGGLGSTLAVAERVKVAKFESAP